MKDAVRRPDKLNLKAFMWPACLQIMLGMAAGFFALSGKGEATNSGDPIRTFADGRRPDQEIFVSAAGSNLSGNGTEEAPFGSITRAVQVVKPGVAIRLLPGRYTAGTLLRNLAGTADAPIWIGGIPGRARPVISGGTTAIQFSKVRYLVLENLEVSGASANGINCDDGGDYANDEATRQVLFRHLFIHDIGTDGIQNGLKLSGVNDYFVMDCDFARISSGGSGIDQVGCHHGFIVRCAFTNAGCRAIQCKGASEDIEIRWNRFVNNGGRTINIGGASGFDYFRPPLSKDTPHFEARNIRVIANLIRGSEAPVAFVGAVNSLVANNTIIEPHRWVLRILQETTSRGGYEFLLCSSNQFLNNLVYFDGAKVNPCVNVGANTEAATFRFANNLWYAFDHPARSRPQLPSTETNGVYGRNPRFHDAAGNDFAVETNSPAVGKGARLPGVKADMLANGYANPPTIGAFEAR